MGVRVLDRIALALVVLGAVNWGLIGLFRFDLVATIFGGVNATEGIMARILYTIIALAGLYCLSFFGRENRHGSHPSHRNHHNTEAHA